MSDAKVQDEKNMPVATAIPVLQAFSVIAVQAIPTASPFNNVMDPHVYSILQNADSLTIRDQVKIAPEYCFGCPPCLAQGKTYYIMAGIDKSGTNTEATLFRADEVSEPWNRCCCNPQHPWKMEFRQYIPTPQERMASGSEASTLWNEMGASWDGMAITKKSAAMKKRYMQTPVAFTAIRDGNQCFCCNGCNDRKCIGGYACCTCCLNESVVVAGATDEGEELHNIGNVGIMGQAKNALGFSQVPILGGMLTPTIHLSDEPFPTENIWGKIEGPTCFGGCSELCCDFEFPVSKMSSESKTGDIARIVKRKPQGGVAGMKEMMSQSDVFTIEFTDKSMTPEQKAAVLGNQIMLDFMFFEGQQNEMCGRDEEGNCYCLLCNCYCFGALIPCRCTVQNNDN